MFSTCSSKAQHSYQQEREGNANVSVACAGIMTVILPRHNEKDLIDILKEIRENMRFLFVDEMREAIAAPLEKSEAEEEPVTCQESPREMRI